MEEEQVEDDGGSEGGEGNGRLFGPAEKKTAAAAGWEEEVDEDKLGYVARPSAMGLTVCTVCNGLGAALGREPRTSSETVVVDVVCESSGCDGI